MTESNCFTGAGNKIYRLQTEAFAVGGEGSIYEVIGEEDVVAKIYFREKVTIERENKILTMLETKSSNMSNFAWPIDILYDNEKSFAGYIMPKISNCCKLVDFYVYDNRAEYDWRIYIRVAQNIAAAVYNIHEIGQVIGDLNPENILCDTETGIVTMVDTDSYHIKDKNGNIMRCEVGMPEFVAPELQDVHFPTVELSRSFTEYSDNFALAVLIFRLLMNGAHPFACTRSNGSTSKFQPVDNIKNLMCVYLSPKSGFDIPIYAPQITALPGYIYNLFRKAFVDSKDSPQLRPSALDWYNALGKLENELIACNRKKTHVFYKSAGKCPWCEVDHRFTVAYKSTLKKREDNAEPYESKSTPVVTNPVVVKSPSIIEKTPVFEALSSESKSMNPVVVFIVAALIIILIDLCIFYYHLGYTGDSSDEYSVYDTSSLDSSEDTSLAQDISSADSSQDASLLPDFYNEEEGEMVNFSINNSEDEIVYGSIGKFKPITFFDYQEFIDEFKDQDCINVYVEKEGVSFDIDLSEINNYSDYCCSLYTRYDFNKMISIFEKCGISLLKCDFFDSRYIDINMYYSESNNPFPDDSDNIQGSMTYVTSNDEHEFEYIFGYGFMFFHNMDRIIDLDYYFDDLEMEFDLKYRDVDNTPTLVRKNCEFYANQNNLIFLIRCVTIEVEGEESVVCAYDAYTCYRGAIYILSYENGYFIPDGDDFDYSEYTYEDLKEYALSLDDFKAYLDTVHP